MRNLPKAEGEVKSGVLPRPLNHDQDFEKIRPALIHVFYLLLPPEILPFLEGVLRNVCYRFVLENRS